MYPTPVVAVLGGQGGHNFDIKQTFEKEDVDPVYKGMFATC